MGTLQQSLFPHLDACLPTPLSAQKKRLVVYKYIYPFPLVESEGMEGAKSTLPNASGVEKDHKRCYVK